MTQSILQQEIMQQPAVIEGLIHAERERVKKLASQFKGRFKYVLIAARGTSDNAARYAQYLFQINNHIPVSLATPSVFSVYQQPPVLDEALVLAISQSGKSPDIISVIEEGRRQGRPTLALTNDPDSPLAGGSGCGYTTCMRVEEKDHCCHQDLHSLSDRGGTALLCHGRGVKAC